MSVELTNEWKTIELKWVKLCKHVMSRVGVEYNFVQINLIFNFIIS